MTTLANYMHSIGLGWFIRTPTTPVTLCGRHGAVGRRLLTSSATSTARARFSRPTRATRRFNAEYNLSTANFCRPTTRQVQRGALPVDLTGARSPCR